MKVVLGTFNNINSSYRVYSKEALEKMIKDAQDKQGGKLVVELGSPKLEMFINKIDFIKRCSYINLCNAAAMINNIEVEVIDDNISYPELKVIGYVEPFNKYLNAFNNANASFALRGFKKGNDLDKIITWDLCTKE